MSLGGTGAPLPQHLATLVRIPLGRKAEDDEDLPPEPLSPEDIAPGMSSKILTASKNMTLLEKRLNKIDLTDLYKSLDEVQDQPRQRWKTVRRGADVASVFT